MKTDPKKLPEDICDYCGKPYGDHPQCDSCGILCCDEYELETYRGHRLCGTSVTRWKRMEEQIGREVSWEFVQEGLHFKDGEPVRVG